MNRTLWTTLVGVAWAAGLLAQTNAPPSVIEIFADQAEFDLKSNLAIYRGNVRVQEPTLQVRCETLTAKLRPGGRQFESIVAEGKVVLDLVDQHGQKIHGTGDKAVYTLTVSDTATNELVELTGNPRLETSQGVLTGEVITLDRMTRKLTAKNQKLVLRAPEESSTNALETLLGPPPKEASAP